MTDQATFDGMEPDGIHIAIVGATLDLGADTEPYTLGESVEFTIKGHVVLVGAETREKEGVRRVVKVRCDYITAK